MAKDTANSSASRGPSTCFCIYMSNFNLTFLWPLKGMVDVTALRESTNQLCMRFGIHSL